MTEDSETIQRARAAALRLLAFRPRSRAELRSRLRRRFPPDVVETVMAELRRDGLLDDAAFAQAWAQERQERRPKSALAVQRELRALGIAPELARRAVEALDDADNAYRAGLKFLPRLAQADAATFRRKMWGYLRRRGFSPSLARQTTERLWKHRDDATHP